MTKKVDNRKQNTVYNMCRASACEATKHQPPNVNTIVFTPGWSPQKPCPRPSTPLSLANIAIIDLRTATVDDILNADSAIFNKICFFFTANIGFLC